MGEGFSMEGSPPLGAACLGVLPAPPFLEGQTVLEGHDFWRQLETVSGFVKDKKPQEKEKEDEDILDK